MKSFQREITIHLLTSELMRVIRETIKNNAPTHYNDYIIINYKDGYRWMMDNRGCDEQPPTLAIDKILTIDTWFVGDGGGFAELYINRKLPQKQIDKIVREALVDDEGNDCYDTVNLGKEVLQNNDSGLWGLLGESGEIPEYISEIPTKKNCKLERVKLINKYYSDLWKRLQREVNSNYVQNNYLQADVYIVKNESDKKARAESANNWQSTFAVKHLYQVIRDAKPLNGKIELSEPKDGTQKKNGYKKMLILYYRFEDTERFYMNFMVKLTIGIKANKKHIQYAVNKVEIK